MQVKTHRQAFLRAPEPSANMLPPSLLQTSLIRPHTLHVVISRVDETHFPPWAAASAGSELEYGSAEVRVWRTSPRPTHLIDFAAYCDEHRGWILSEACPGDVPSTISLVLHGRQSQLVGSPTWGCGSLFCPWRCHCGTSAGCETLVSKLSTRGNPPTFWEELHFFFQL